MADTGTDITTARDAMRERLAAQGMTDLEYSGATGDEALANILTEIMQAESANDVLDNVSVGAEEVVNVPLKVREVLFREGDFGPFAILDAVNTQTGEVLSVSCGGEVVVAQLLKLVELAGRGEDIFPLHIRILERTSRAGYTVYRLAKASAGTLDV